MVLTADSMFGEFLAELKARGQYDNSYLIVAADHGESLDNGFVGHSGPSVLEDITHVPFIIHPPGNQEQKRINTLGANIDITPTILDLLGIEKLASMMGESLLPYVQDPTKENDRIRFTVSFSAIYGKPGEVALYWKNYKVIYLNHDRYKVKLFDLESDPGATVDISAKRPQIVEKMMKLGGVW